MNEEDKLADRLIEEATKEEVTDVARLLAIQGGYYETRYAEMPQDLLRRTIKTGRIDAKTAPVLLSGMQNLIAALVQVRGLDDALEEASRHARTALPPACLPRTCRHPAGSRGTGDRRGHGGAVRRQQHRIRLAGIDAPKRKQPFGRKSKQYLAAQIAGQEVSVDWHKLDRYHRIVGKIIHDGKDVDLAMVRAGLAWWYRHYAHEQSPADRLLYEDAENKAKAEGQGLWQDPDPMPPWQWRHRR
jgi:endonuclease YncB( thermonuclease family)